jgi:2,3-dihydroxybenzoate decarboxylase
MFAADYPFESAQEAGAFMDKVAIAEPVRSAIATDNAARYLRLPQSVAA